MRIGILEINWLWSTPNMLYMDKDLRWDSSVKSLFGIRFMAKWEQSLRFYVFNNASGQQSNYSAMFSLSKSGQNIKVYTTSRLSTKQHL